MRHPPPTWRPDEEELAGRRAGTVVPDSVARLLERVPMRWVRLDGAVALTGLGICSLVRAIGNLG
jgi:hypothetical protein